MQQPAEKPQLQARNNTSSESHTVHVDIIIHRHGCVVPLPVVNGLTPFPAHSLPPNDAHGTGGWVGMDTVCLVVERVVGLVVGLVVERVVGLVVERVVGLVVGAAVGVCRSHFSPNHPSLHKQTLFVRHLCQNGAYRPENQNKPENIIILR